MTTNAELQRVEEWGWLRGFANLLRKENQEWWGTRRGWINALLWSGMLGGLVGIMLYVLPTIAEAANDPNIAAVGGPLPFALEMGRTVFFELGTMALAIGVVILCQDMIVNEKQSGVTEWLLAKPVSRRAYILSKLAATLVAVMVLLVGMPALVSYTLLSFRAGTPFPLPPFLSGVGIMALHTFFYLTLTVMLGTLFNNRTPLLGIALGTLLGGNLLASLLKPLLYVTPWMLAKVASLLAGEQAVPNGLLWPPLAATAVWCLVFILVALTRFEKTQF
ncbi:MAG: ABC transporter permease subunit [Anaerolineales bacterium]|nr:ABC transporter permease subunit [Anaerolineales bacterium]